MPPLHPWARITHPKLGEAAVIRTHGATCGITVRPTAPSPTTTGKIKRWHKSLPRELLPHSGPFADQATAQATARPGNYRCLGPPSPRTANGQAALRRRCRPAPTAKADPSATAAPPTPSCQRVAESNPVCAN